ncbi:hypothetical protein ACSBR1_026100 [Camellia fascicularis]
MDKLKEIHAHVITTGLALFNQIVILTIFDFNSMIMGYSKISYPKRVFKFMPKCDVKALNQMITLSLF